MDEKYVGAVYGLVPFLVLISVTESTRSYRYEMEELELSSRFSLKSIVMARMVILGVGGSVKTFVSLEINSSFLVRITI